ncbi:aminotransferase class V-fold PLP-dependent enzyme [Stenotrophomonas sp.]|uniref:aminotransferase class V-fold PLP-dependent enzyme n=1 Tax=Stenotrophomonas sp. TaxID=69392 RepID=UPI0028A693D5|nr:aminotransferase class V-fold PLP-dependent enzyme [Stenotrophomonas sp.]
MHDAAQHHCKTVSDQKWSLSTFMEFYERVLGPRLFKPYGQLLVHEIRADIDPLAPPSAVLEVACGTGLITRHLYEDLAKPLNLQLVATDLSKIAVDVAKQVLSEELQRDVSFQSDVDMADLPFADNSFDIIVCGFGLMFPPDKARVAREFKRVLRPGGKIYGTLFRYNELFDLAWKQSLQHFGTPSAIMDAALSLTDPSTITQPFALEGLDRGIDEVTVSRPLAFHLDDADAREFLFNACILLEEFNQCDTSTRERYLDRMLEAFNTQVPDHNYQVDAWLLRGRVDPAGKEVVVASALPDFSTVVAFRALTQEVSALDAGGISESSCRQLQTYRAVKTAFLASNPGFADAEVELMRRQEFSRLDLQHVTYLDHVGGALPPESLLEQDLQTLKTSILGNPHSGSATSAAAYAKAREDIFRFFNGDPSEYEIIFTANASAAIRLVAESFPFEAGSQVLLSKDNHTSVHGLREYARAKGASVKYVPLDKSLQINGSLLQRSLEQLPASHPHLLAFPAQSNATGIRHDLSLIRQAQAHGAMVLCDAAAFVPQARLDLSTHQPDFVAISFYKMFGYPTGAGCLIARKSSLARLTPPSFAGGAVCYYSGPWSPTDRLLYRENGQRFEIGTPNYASFPSISHGLEFITGLGLDTLALRSTTLARWLEAQLLELRHETKSRTALCRIYGAPGLPKGATLMLNFFDCYNAVMPHALVRRAAESFGISVRNGCFCNLGAVQQATYTTAGAEHCELDKGEKVLDCRTFDEKILGKGDCGAVRVSFGLGSNFADAYRFYLFARCLLNIESPGLQAAIGGDETGIPSPAS